LAGTNLTNLKQQELLPYGRERTSSL